MDSKRTLSKGPETLVNSTHLAFLLEVATLQARQEDWLTQTASGTRKRHSETLVELHGENAFFLPLIAGAVLDYEHAF